MASEEGWVGIADVAAHLSVAKDSIYRWVDPQGLPRSQSRTAPALSALRSGRVGKNRRRE